MIGRIIGYFLVLEYSPRIKEKLNQEGYLIKYKFPAFNCICRCGSIVNVLTSTLTNTPIPNCGCKPLKSDYKAYGSYRKMKQRCLNPRHISYPFYKNILICQRWLDSFDNFLSDMGERPLE